MMKEGLDTFYEGLVYEEGFGPSELRPSIQRKRLINTHSIMEVASNLERKKDIWEGQRLIPSLPFFT